MHKSQFISCANIDFIRLYNITKEAMKIKKVTGRQILDSRGCPTVECMLELEDGVSVIASVPSGASVGKYEAKELRDNDPEHFEGKGVLKAIAYLEDTIAPLLVGKEPDVISMDAAMITCDGTGNKSRLGANAILAASIAVTRAQAVVQGLEPYELINELWNFASPCLPLCMFNIINGGMHAESGLAFQEFMIMPHNGSFKDRLEDADKIYHALKRLLHEKNYSTAIGDEGGFAPFFGQKGILKEKAALDLLKKSCNYQAYKMLVFVSMLRHPIFMIQRKKYIVCMNLNFVLRI